jgi:uncharacterized membrane protein
VYNFIHSLLSNFTLTFFIVGLICSVVAIYRHWGQLTKALIAELIFKYYCFWAQGICWTYNGVIHVIFHQMAAGFIGWADSPFQIEVGVASLGFGLVGLVAIKKSFGLRLALVISTATFLWGCAAGHIYQMNMAGNHSEGNSGLMLWTGLLMPVVSIVLLWLSYTTSKPKFIN